MDLELSLTQTLVETLVLINGIQSFGMHASQKVRQQQQEEQSALVRIFKPGYISWVNSELHLHHNYIDLPT